MQPDKICLYPKSFNRHFDIIWDISLSVWFFPPGSGIANPVRGWSVADGWTSAGDGGWQWSTWSSARGEQGPGGVWWMAAFARYELRGFLHQSKGGRDDVDVFPGTTSTTSPPHLHARHGLLLYQLYHIISRLSIYYAILCSGVSMTPHLLGPINPLLSLPGRYGQTAWRVGGCFVHGGQSHRAQAADLVTCSNPWWSTYMSSKKLVK